MSAAFCPYVALPAARTHEYSATGPSTIARRPRAITSLTPTNRATGQLQTSRTAVYALFERRKHASTTTTTTATATTETRTRTTTRARATSSPSPSPSFSPSPSPSPSPPPSGGGAPNPRGNRSPDFHANVGTVIDTLRADYPHMLTQAPDLAMFRDYMVLSDAKGNRLSGKDAYRTVLFLLRAHARLFLTSASLHILSLYYQDAVQPSIHVRWRMRATPRVWASTTRDAPSIVDGLSVYYLDGAGHVVHHAFETRVRNGPTVVRPVFQHVAPVPNIAVETGMNGPRRMAVDADISVGAIVNVGADSVADAREKHNVAKTPLWMPLPLPTHLALAHHMYRAAVTSDDSHPKCNSGGCGKEVYNTSGG